MFINVNYSNNSGLISVQKNSVPEIGCADDMEIILRITQFSVQEAPKELKWIYTEVENKGTLYPDGSWIPI